ncbi:MAG TPA: hypothetical protein VG502_01795 [Flexivirga sp.]|uniref:hypothetical protein n=1 Tax=Flexivirga sp. TaxID=1962927 RepID=UPI002C56E202|nr:hypothetical protein [Flexivirga sp.]HWC21009.1 hypothetical protein [Flexivirga sp.]
MSSEESELRLAEEQSHYEKAQDWLERAEEAYERFDADREPRDVSLLRKAEVAIGLSQAHAALARIEGPQHLRVGPTEIHRSWTAAPKSPVPSAAEAHTGVRH